TAKSASAAPTAHGTSVPAVPKDGERKQVTVLLTDVFDFTSISSQLDPEDLHDIMDRCVQTIIGAVQRYEGTVAQFVGDGVMALFGAPIAHEDHPHRAIRAALAIQREVDPLIADVRRTHGVEFRVRVGIHTGLVVLKAIGRDSRTDYTAVGETTHLATQILEAGAPGQVVVSQQTQRATEGYFLFEELGEFRVKGREEPVRAYAAKSEVAGRTRLDTSKERGL